MNGPVVTGLGIVAPTGVGIERFWAATCRGESAIAPITRFPTQTYPVTLAGEVSEVRPAVALEPRTRAQTDRWTHLALIAADLALEDACVDPTTWEPYALSVMTASSAGGVDFGQREIQALWRGGPRDVSVYQSIAWFYAATTGQLSIRNGFKGHSSVIAAEQAGGLDAFSHARRAIARGNRVALTGGTEAPLCPYALTCQISSGLLSRSRDAKRAYMPFSSSACGYVPGEGGAILLLEDAHAANERGARVYARVTGHAATHEGHHLDTDPSGRPLARAIAIALDEAGLRPQDVGAVFADATGTVEADRREAAALVSVFGPHAVPVTAPKAGVGRLYAGGAALDVAVAALTLDRRVVPPTPNADPDPVLRLDLVRQARPLSSDHVVVVARGHGGFNSALVLSAA